MKFHLKGQLLKTFRFKNALLRNPTTPLLNQNKTSYSWLQLDQHAYDQFPRVGRPCVGLSDITTNDRKQR